LSPTVPFRSDKARIHWLGRYFARRPAYRMWKIPPDLRRPGDVCVRKTAHWSSRGQPDDRCLLRPQRHRISETRTGAQRGPL